MSSVYPPAAVEVSRNSKKHIQTQNLSYGSTLSDANKRRHSNVFAGICNDPLKKFGYFISDSRVLSVINREIEIFDSTTIRFFQNILKCTGSTSVDGKRKGGIKLHNVINVDETVPKLVWFTSPFPHDHALLDKLKFNKDTIYVFDKGYNHRKGRR